MNNSRIFDNNELQPLTAREFRNWRTFFALFLLATLYRIHAVYGSVNGLLDTTSSAQVLTDVLILADFVITLSIVRPLLRKARWAWITAAILVVQRIATNLPVLCLLWFRLEAPFLIILPMLATVIVSGAVLYKMLTPPVRARHHIDGSRIWIPLASGCAIGMAHLGTSVFLIYSPNL